MPSLLGDNAFRHVLDAPDHGIDGLQLAGFTNWDSSFSVSIQLGRPVGTGKTLEVRDFEWWAHRDSNLGCADYLSAEAHNLWRGVVPYRDFQMRRYVSIQFCRQPGR